MGRSKERRGWDSLDAVNKKLVAEGMSHLYRKTRLDPTAKEISKALGEPVKKMSVSGQGMAAPED
jgi:hypothetical protein